MKVHMKGVAVIAAAVVAAGAAHAQSTVSTAQAFDVTPSYSHTTRTECTSSGNGVPGWLGQALGGVIGAGAGSQIGKGTGNSAAAAAGAVLGAQAGAAMSGSGQPSQTCREVTERSLAGYVLRTTSGDVFVPAELAQRFAAGR